MNSYETSSQLVSNSKRVTRSVPKTPKKVANHRRLTRYAHTRKLNAPMLNSRESREMPGSLMLRRNDVPIIDDDARRNEEVVKTVVEWNVMLWTRRGQGKSHKKRKAKQKVDKKEAQIEEDKETSKMIAKANQIRNEEEAKAKNVNYEVTRYDLDQLDRALADREAHGFIKVLTAPGKDKILGVTIVGYHAGELISEFVFAMTHGMGLKKISAVTHIYPTLLEANKFAANAWRNARLPKKYFPWAERFFRWLRK